MFEQLYDMYVKDKVPDKHWVPKIEVDEWFTLSENLNTFESPNEWKIYFPEAGGAEACISVSFPELGGVRISGEKKGYFDCDALPIKYLTDGSVREAVAENGYSARLKCGKDFSIELLFNGNTFFTVSADMLSYGYLAGERKKLAINIPIDTDEKISGFGEKYNSINQVGKILPIHNDDTGYHGHTEEGDKCRSYKNVPIFHSSKGYTLFNSTFYSGIADLTVKGNFRFDFNSPLLDMFLWCGKPADTLESYTRLTGRPVLPPKWAFEFWAGGGGCHWAAKGEDNCAEVFKEAVEGYKRMGTLPSAFYGEGKPSVIKECYGMLEDINSRMLAWNHPGTDVYIKCYDVSRIRDTFPGIKDEDIPMFHDSETDEIFDRSQFYIDYSHPKALDLMRDKYAEFKELGLKGAMVDFGEYVEQYVKAYNGMKGDEMHNFYGYCYSKTLHDVWEEISPDDYILFCRAACAGTQKWLCFFGGDQRGEFYGLRQAYYGGLNAALSGFTIWGSDIGSLSDNNSEELYLRWLQFGAFSPLMRTHGNHNAWNYGERCEEIFKKYFWFRKNILDYIYGAVVETHNTGKPIMQVVSAYYPSDKHVRFADDQYMFGDSLMVCPVLYEGMTEREVIFPEGDDWTELATGKCYKGGTSATVASPLDICPVFIKAGAAVPVTVSENGELAKPFEGDGVKALAVTAGNGKSVLRESDSVSYLFECEKSGNDFRLINNDGYAAQKVIVFGKVSEAFADGKALEVENREIISVINLENANWKELKII